MPQCHLESLGKYEEFIHDGSGPWGCNVDVVVPRDRQDPLSRVEVVHRRHRRSEGHCARLRPATTPKRDQTLKRQPNPPLTEGDRQLSLSFWNC